MFECMSENSVRRPVLVGAWYELVLHRLEDQGVSLYVLVIRHTLSVSMGALRDDVFLVWLEQSELSKACDAILGRQRVLIGD